MTEQDNRPPANDDLSRDEITDEPTGDGGGLGTPGGLDEAPVGDEEDSMVVSGGGVADTSDTPSATGPSDRGLG